MSNRRASHTVDANPKERRRPTRRTILSLVPVAVVASAVAGLGAARHLNPPPPPATPLGAVESIKGGFARIHGIIPLESVPWRPPAPTAALAAPTATGGHRVRVIMEVTAIDAGGVRFRPSEFTVEEITGFGADPLWASTAAGQVPQGESWQVTFVFEIPNKSIQLVLKGPQQIRMSLGTNHHSTG